MVGGEQTVSMGFEKPFLIPALCNAEIAIKQSWNQSSRIDLQNFSMCKKMSYKPVGVWWYLQILWSPLLPVPNVNCLVLILFSSDFKSHDNHATWSADWMSIKGKRHSKKYSLHFRFCLQLFRHQIKDLKTEMDEQLVIVTLHTP